MDAAASLHHIYSLGAHPKIIRAIMPHADIGTTLLLYISTPDSDSRAAMEKLEERIRNTPSGVNMDGKPA